MRLLIPLLVSSRDFVAVKLQCDAKAAAVRRDARTAKAIATQLVNLSQEPGQHPFVKLIITLQAKEAEGFAAPAAGDDDNAVRNLKEAVAIEDSIDDLSQPPYPVIPATELCGNLLLDLNRPAEAATYLQKTLSQESPFFWIPSPDSRCKVSVRLRRSSQHAIWSSVGSLAPERVTYRSGIFAARLRLPGVAGHVKS